MRISENKRAESPATKLTSYDDMLAVLEGRATLMNTRIALVRTILQWQHPDEASAEAKMVQ